MDAIGLRRQKREAARRALVERRGFRFAFLAAGFIALVSALYGGLMRIGWVLPWPPADLVSAHGALMTGGFFGALIGLERAVALGRLWPYLGPFSVALGTLAIWAGAPEMGLAFYACGGLVLAAASAFVWYRQRETFTAVIALGAAFWALGMFVWWLGGDRASAVVALMLFLVLTIVGERLELTRVLPPRPRAKPLFRACVMLVLAGAALVPFWQDPGLRLLGLGFLSLAAWLATYDIARRTVRQSGLVRYAALCLLSGYGWLAVGGAILLAAPEPFGGLYYDAGLHAIFLGFVFAMVFAHAPIIFPAVVRLPVPFRPHFYVHLALLHLSLLVRLAGDLADNPDLRMAGGLGNAAAIVLFILATAGSVIAARMAARA